MFRLPGEVFDDKELVLDKAPFIIECLNLYRLLLLNEDDTVRHDMTVLTLVWSSEFRT